MFQNIIYIGITAALYFMVSCTSQNNLQDYSADGAYYVPSEETETQSGQQASTAKTNTSVRNHPSDIDVNPNAAGASVRYNRPLNADEPINTSTSNNNPTTNTPAAGNTTVQYNFNQYGGVHHYDPFYRHKSYSSYYDPHYRWSYPYYDPFCPFNRHYYGYYNPYGHQYGYGYPRYRSGFGFHFGYRTHYAYHKRYYPGTTIVYIPASSSSGSGGSSSSGMINAPRSGGPGSSIVTGGTRDVSPRQHRMETESSDDSRADSRTIREERREVREERENNTPDRYRSGLSREDYNRRSTEVETRESRSENASEQQEKRESITPRSAMPSLGGSSADRERSERSHNRERISSPRSSPGSGSSRSFSPSRSNDRATPSRSNTRSNDNDRNRVRESRRDR